MLKKLENKRQKYSRDRERERQKVQENPNVILSNKEEEGEEGRQVEA